MRGKVCTYQKCPECGSVFDRIIDLPTLTILACPEHNHVLPTRLYLDIYHQGKRHKIPRNERQHLLSSCEMASALLAEIRAKGFDPTKFVKRKLEVFYLSTILKSWLEDAGDLAKGTRDLKERFSRLYFEPYWEDTDIREITKHDINKFKKSLKHPSPITKNGILDQLRTVFNYAIQEELMEDSPMKRIKNFDVPKVQPEALTLEDQNTVLDVIEDFHQPIFRFGVLTGCRKSEARALQWEDIKWQDGYILFQHNYSGEEFNQHLKEGDQKPFPLIPELLELLTSIPRQISGPVFINQRTNKPYSKNMNTILDRAFTATEVPRIPLENFFRHSFASNCVDAGVHVSAVSALLGHSSTRITEKHYLKVRVKTLGDVLELRKKSAHSAKEVNSNG